MKRFGVVLMVLVAGVAYAQPAVVASTQRGNAACGMLDSRGGVFQAARTVIVFSDGAVSVRCNGYQGFPAGQRVVYNFASLGSTCGNYVGGSDCVPIPEDPGSVICACSLY